MYRGGTLNCWARFINLFLRLTWVQELMTNGHRFRLAILGESATLLGHSSDRVPLFFERLRDCLHPEPQSSGRRPCDFSTVVDVCHQVQVR